MRGAIPSPSVKDRSSIIRSNVNLTDVFKSMSIDLRRAILKSIADAGKTGITHSEIFYPYKDIKDERSGKRRYTPSNFSQHLKNLALAGLIIVRKEGNRKRYFFNKQNAQVFRDFVDSLDL